MGPLDGGGEALRSLVNEASRIERAQHLQAMPYERSAQREPGLPQSYFSEH